MTNVYMAQASYSRGSLSHRVAGRSDIEQYRSALESCVNWTVMRQGGLKKRGGSMHISPSKNGATEACTLIPFTFSFIQAYVLEFGTNYFRVFANLAQVVDGVPLPVEVVTTYSAAEAAEIHYSQSADVLYLRHKNHPPRIVKRTSDTAWTIEDQVFVDGPFLDQNEAGTSFSLSSTGNPIPLMTSNTLPSGIASSTLEAGGAYQAFDGANNTYVITSGVVEGDIAYEFTSTKVINGYYISCYVLEISAPEQWEFQGWDGAKWITLDSRSKEIGWTPKEVRFYEFKNDTAYIKYRHNFTASVGGTSTGITAIGYKESATTAPTITLTASAVTGINDDTGFQSGDVGRHIRVRGSDSKWRWMKIDSVTSTTVVEVKLHSPPFVEIPTTISWRMGAWSSFTGYPARVSFYNERLFDARTDKQPQGIWGSTSQGFNEHTISSPLVGDDAIALQFTSSQVNEVNFLIEGFDLQIGTSAAIRTIGSLGSTEPFTALKFRQRRQSTEGASSVQPVQIGNTTIFADVFNRTLRELSYSFEINGYRAPELSILSDHLFAGVIARMAYAQHPDSIVWTILADGSAVPMTYEQQQQVVGLTSASLPGGTIESVAVIPGPAHSEVWMSVKRTINGATVRHIEVLANNLDNVAAEDGVFLDASLQYDGAPATVFTGFDHLEGETIAIVGDGTRREDVTVASGGFTLTKAVSKLCGGISYEATGKTLRAPVGFRDGSPLGRRMNVSNVVADVYNTPHLKIGNDTQQDELFFRTGSSVGLSPLTGFTGTKQVQMDGSWDDEGQITFKSDQPFNAMLRALNIELTVGS